MLNENENRAC